MFVRFVKKPFRLSNISTNQWFNLSNWYKTPLGVSFEKQEKAVLDRSLRNLFGYYLLQIGKLGQLEWHQQSRVSHCLTLDQSVANLTDKVSKKNAIDVFANALELPIQSASIDVLILPHLLEFSNDPHQILREADRVLIPEGHVLLLAFNPLSVWILFRWLFMWRREVPWCGRFFSRTRVKDWLALLGFDILECHSYFYRPAIQHQSFMSKIKFIEIIGRRFWPILGGGYLIVAKKRVNTLTPIKPRWKTRGLVTSGLETSNKTSSLRNQK